MAKSYDDMDEEERAAWKAQLAAAPPRPAPKPWNPTPETKAALDKAMAQIDRGFGRRPLP